MGECQEIIPNQGATSIPLFRFSFAHHLQCLHFIMSISLPIFFSLPPILICIPMSPISLLILIPILTTYMYFYPSFHHLSPFKPTFPYSYMSSIPSKPIRLAPLYPSSRLPSHTHIPLSYPLKYSPPSITIPMPMRHEPL